MVRACGWGDIRSLWDEHGNFKPSCGKASLRGNSRRHFLTASKSPVLIASIGSPNLILR